MFDNSVEIFSLQLSRLLLSTHYDRVRTLGVTWSFITIDTGVVTQEMSRLRRHVDEMNHQLFNPVGLNILWPRKVGFLFVSTSSTIE